MKFSLATVTGLIACTLTALTAAYAFAFLDNLWLPKTIDGPATRPFGDALAINAGLVTLMAALHRATGRPAFRRWLLRLAPCGVARSLPVLVVSATVIVLLQLWQPIGIVVWAIEWLPGRMAVSGTYIAAWCLLVVQALRWRRPVRPITHAALIVFAWAAPTMTASRLVLAVGLTMFTLLAAEFRRPNPL